MNTSIQNLMVILLLSMVSCTTGFPKFDGQIDESISLSQVIENPGRFQEKTVLWGGKIVRTVNRKEGTMIEILQLPLDSAGRPKGVDTSEGRFLALYSDYLDTMIYREGRDVTVSGRLTGVRTYPLGEITYDYPLLKAVKIHLWKEREESINVYHNFPPGYWHRPYWAW